MLFRNGTHLIDTICYFAESDPEWVSAELEDGYEDYSEYRGDGGHDPKTEPSAHGYIHFANGVRGYYAGGPKITFPRGMALRSSVLPGISLLMGKKPISTEMTRLNRFNYPNGPSLESPPGVQELVRLIDEGGEPVSPGKAAHKVVEIMIGFLESQRRGNAKVTIPVPRN